MHRGLLSYPLEITHTILFFCHPQDVVSFSITSRTAHNLVEDPDQYLWRNLFLLYFDDPRQSPLQFPYRFPIQWKIELLERMRAAFTATHIDEVSGHARERAVETLIVVALDALPLSTSSYIPSLNIAWLENILRESRILDLHPSSNDAGLLSRLRAYCIDNDSLYDTSIIGSRRTSNRCFVYDLRNYYPGNKWGPFLQNGEVNWVHVEALMEVILSNIRELPRYWGHSKPPLGLEATRPYSAPRVNQIEDWAGIEGTWRRYVCFMDYRDLFAFNFSTTAGGPRNPSFFEDHHFREATRLIELNLTLAPKEKFRYFDKNEIEENSASSTFRPLHFVGTSRGVNGSEAIVEGVVSMRRQGHVLWQFVYIYDGHSLWSSTGVQIGNAQSGIGIVGSWTTTIHDKGDPVGPFWLWKVKDDHHRPLVDYV